METCGNLECLVGSLMLVILARLDLHSLSRARCVCKSWYAVICSQDFLAIRRQLLLPEEIWVVMRVRINPPVNAPMPPYSEEWRDRRSYCTELWRLIAVGSQQQQIIISSTRKCFWPWLSRHFGPHDVASMQLPLGAQSSNGLVCSKLLEDDHRSFLLIVGNPITNQWKKLPPAPWNVRIRSGGHPLPITFNYDVKRMSYTILAFEDCRQDFDAQGNSVNAVAQYESRLGTWLTVPGFDPSQPAVDDAELLFSCSLFCKAMARHDTIAAYDPEAMTWYHVPLPYPGQQLYSSQVFRDDKRRIILFPSLSRRDSAFEVWSLRTDCCEWRLLSSLKIKDAFGNGWVVHHDIDLKVEFVGNWLVFFSWYRNFLFGSLPPVAFNLETSEWCVYPVSNRGWSKKCSYTFVPSLTAQP